MRNTKTAGLLIWDAKIRTQFWGIDDVRIVADSALFDISWCRHGVHWWEQCYRTHEWQKISGYEQNFAALLADEWMPNPDAAPTLDGARQGLDNRSADNKPPDSNTPSHSSPGQYVPPTPAHALLFHTGILLLARYVPNVAKRSIIWHQCINDRPTTDLSFGKFWMAISPRRVIRSTSCLVLE